MTYILKHEKHDIQQQKEALFERQAMDLKEQRDLEEKILEIVANTKVVNLNSFLTSDREVW